MITDATLRDFHARVTADPERPPMTATLQPDLIAAIRNAEIRSTYDPLVVRVFDLTTEEKFWGRRPLSLVTVDKVMRVCAAGLDVSIADVDPGMLPVENAEWVRDVCVQSGFTAAGPFGRQIPPLVVTAWRRAYTVQVAR